MIEIVDCNGTCFLRDFLDLQLAHPRKAAPGTIHLTATRRHPYGPSLQVGGSITPNTSRIDVERYDQKVKLAAVD